MNLSIQQASLDKHFKTNNSLTLLTTTLLSSLFTTKLFKMKFTLPLLALLAGFAAAKIDGSSVNDIDNNELGEGAPNYCPVGRPCSSDRVRDSLIA